MEAMYRLSPLLRSRSYQGEPFPVPKNTKSRSGSYTMVSHTLPPPPAFHHSPDHVAAARRMASDSNGFDGSPGTVYVRQTRLPVSASYAETKPRTAYSDPAFPMITRPLAIRGAPVIAYG